MKLRILICIFLMSAVVAAQQTEGQDILDGLETPFGYLSETLGDCPTLTPVTVGPMGPSSAMSSDGEFAVHVMDAYHYEHKAYVYNLRCGQAGPDNDVQAGFIMYSIDNVHKRFFKFPPHPENSDHLIVVRWNGTTSAWEYTDDLNWHVFKPVEGDRLLAAVVTGANASVSSLQDWDDEYKSIKRGYECGDLEFHANQFCGAANPGEFETTGTFFTTFLPPGPQELQDLRRVRIAELNLNCMQGAPPYLQTNIDFTIAEDLIVGWGRSLVAVNGSGDMYVVAWENNDGGIDVQIFEPADPGPNINRHGNDVACGRITIPVDVDDQHQTPTLLGLYSLEMRADGRFAVAWERLGDGSAARGTSFKTFDVDLLSTKEIFTEVAHVQDMVGHYAVLAWSNHGSNEASPLNVVTTNISEELETEIILHKFDNGKSLELVSNVPSIFNKQVFNLGNTGGGQAVGDFDQTEEGYIMYSDENVFTRFARNPPYSENSEHLIVVRYLDHPNRPRWQYNDNFTWHEILDIAETDRLLARINMKDDTIPEPLFDDFEEHGIQAGFDEFENDLEFFVNRFAGVTNPGEFETTGTFFSAPVCSGDKVLVGPLGAGIAVDDGDTTEEGYIMHSVESVFTRFPTQPFGGNAEHLIVVRYFNNVWQYNDNNNWNDFIPDPQDRLLAEVDMLNDAVESLQRMPAGFAINGMDAGYWCSDLDFMADRWANAANNGEFTVTGSFYILETEPDSNLAMHYKQFGLANDPAGNVVLATQRQNAPGDSEGPVDVHVFDPELKRIRFIDDYPVNQQNVAPMIPAVSMDYDSSTAGVDNIIVATQLLFVSSPLVAEEIGGHYSIFDMDEGLWSDGADEDFGVVPSLPPDHYSETETFMTVDISRDGNSWNIAHLANRPHVMEPIEDFWGWVIRPWMIICPE